jgi:hypothetical protein
MIIHYSGRTTPIEINAAETLVPGCSVMLSIDTLGGIRTK